MRIVSEFKFRPTAAAVWESVRRTFAAHVPLYLCTAFIMATTVAILLIYDLPFPLGSGLFFLYNIGEAVVLVAAVTALRETIRLFRAGMPENPLMIMAQRLFSAAMAEDRVGNMAHGLATFTPLMMIFAALKIDIARIVPFSWDATFMQLGLTIGLGHHYWQLLQPILGYPPITTLLSFAYGLWFPAMFGCLFWQLSRPHHDETRAQYLLAFALAWFFGGFVIATAFSSAGPCFYSHFVSGPNPYAPLLHYLRETRQHWPVWTVDAQDDLWRAYLTGKGDIQGISAMPSMHVMIATLMALLGWRVNRHLGRGFTLFAVIILISSIMLGWHYSADGIAGAALGIAFWGIAGKLSRSWTELCERQRLAVPVAGAGEAIA
jgi:membrane-associated phospholipid phosphatase